MNQCSSHFLEAAVSAQQAIACRRCISDFKIAIPAKEKQLFLPGALVDRPGPDSFLLVSLTHGVVEHRSADSCDNTAAYQRLGNNEHLRRIGN